ncbi:MAG: M3 family oligoendopeptidase, partial [Deltaproteobacteria bacterium]|nr:M3 family oligoendopeptidase [Deltaproteobacteria bacterium]
TLEKEERRLAKEIDPVVEELNFKIRQQLLNAPFLSQLQAKHGKLYFDFLKIQQDAFEESNIPLETQLSEVLSDYTKLNGQASLEVEGKTYPISHYKKFSVSPDSKLRKASFLSYSSWYLRHRKDLETLFDRAYQIRQKMGQNLGYDHFIPLAYQNLHRLDYGPEEVQSLREQILEVVVPLASKLHQEQAQALGSSKLKVWDLDFHPHYQSGGLKVSIQEQSQAALKIFEKLSTQLAEYFRRMLQHSLIDVPAREGKAPGAFCTDFSDYRVPFVFLNSVGEWEDLSTFLHECGHSFQAWASADIDLLELRWPGLEACEVHSMGMELLAYPYLGEFLKEEDIRPYQKKHLSETITILPYLAMVDDFQHQVYSQKLDSSVSRAQVWKTLEEKYLPSLDFSDQPDWQESRWIRQMHIFQAPFYYIDYAIAQIGAWQLWLKSLKNHEEAMTSYLKLCSLGGALPLKEFFASGGLSLPFESGMLKKLMEEVWQAWKAL